MFTKRPDKYTTGLINMRNDCFANSSLQAYSALPGLTDYLNDFIMAFVRFEKLVRSHGIDLFRQTTEDRTDNPKFKKIQSKFDIPLHLSLAKIIKKLQSTQMTSKTISVWTFLHEVEKIFNAKISRSQHDAHELTQLINETLENENIKIHKHYKRLVSDLQDKSDMATLADLKDVELPEFPFSGLLLTQMKCLNCKGVSKPQFSPFLMVTLHTPQTASTNLESLLNDNESESIEGYQCLRCRITYITNNEKYLQDKGDYTVSEDEAETIKKLRDLNADPAFCINEDLSKDLESYVKSYNKHGIDISRITSTVLRTNQILKPPKILGFHLSRSSFDGMSATRNSCRVSFRDHLNLSIGKDYHEDLKQFQLAAAQDDSLSDEPIKSKVLTTDVDDMEDEEVQREDISDASEDDGESTEDNADNDDDHTNDDATDAETTSDASSLATEVALKDDTKSLSKGSTSTTRTPESLNNAPISEGQSDDLLNHFKKFKFNDNDVYKYRLKAMIRHQGSHTQGHYECYKRKPLYVRDKDGLIIKISPEIHDDLVDDVDPDKATISLTRKSSDGSDSRIGFTDPERSDILQNINEDNIPLQSGNFRRKLSNMMGRRPSILQADPHELAIKEIINSGTTTPAEFALSGGDYFDLPAEINAKLDSQKETKLKKIPSLIKNPFWRISDSQIAEVSKASVLCETTSVYMLYYERSDRK